MKRVEQLAKKREQRRQMEREEKEQKEFDSLRRSVIATLGPILIQRKIWLKSQLAR